MQLVGVEFTVACRQDDCRYQDQVGRTEPDDGWTGPVWTDGWTDVYVRMKCFTVVFVLKDHRFIPNNVIMRFMITSPTLFPMLKIVVYESIIIQVSSVEL